MHNILYITMWEKKILVRWLEFEESALTKHSLILFFGKFMFKTSITILYVWVFLFCEDDDAPTDLKTPSREKLISDTGNLQAKQTQSDLFSTRGKNTYTPTSAELGSCPAYNMARNSKFNNMAVPWQTNWEWRRGS